MAVDKMVERVEIGDLGAGYQLAVRQVGQRFYPATLSEAPQHEQHRR
jgi:hypothetical protein